MRRAVHGRDMRCPLRQVDYVAGNGDAASAGLSFLQWQRRSNTRQDGLAIILREWRQRRRVSQLALATDAEISARHLSFVETGRAQPSRDMVLHLADQLDVPLRERNVLLVSGRLCASVSGTHTGRPGAERGAPGHRSPAHRARAFSGARDRQTLEPGRAGNAAVGRLLTGIDPCLAETARERAAAQLCIRSDLRRALRNLAEWRAHLLERLRRQIDVSGDTVLSDLCGRTARVIRAAFPARATTTLQASVIVPAAAEDR